MQPAIMSYCLKNGLPEADQTPEKILELAAAEGIRNVEFYAGRWDVEGDLRSAAESLKGFADGIDVSMPVYGSGTRLGHIGDQKQLCMDKLKQEVEACAILGGSVVAFPVLDGQPMPPDRPNAPSGSGSS